MTEEPIFIDWDVSYRGWHSHAFRAKEEVRVYPGGQIVHRAVRSGPWIESRIRRWADSIGLSSSDGLDGFVVRYRSSSSGRVHLSIESLFPIRLNSGSRYLLRYMLLDDPARLECDFIREGDGTRTNRLFDTKCKSDGTIGHAGEWQDWLVVRL